MFSIQKQSGKRESGCELTREEGKYKKKKGIAIGRRKTGENEGKSATLRGTADRKPPGLLW